MPVETSIVIRTLNEAQHLEKLLQGIHGQNYHDWEIVLVDSGSTDGTVDLARRYGARIFHIPSHEFTYGRSLNIGCREAVGRYLVFASGHVWPITNNWLQNIVRPFEDPSIAMVYGRQRGTDASRLSEMRDLSARFGPTSHILVDEPKGNNGNAAIRRQLWLDYPFDESLPGLEDVDWAQRVERNGYRIYYAADAPVYHLHEESLRQVYRRHLREADATKRIFPHNRFTWWDVARGLPYFIARDVLYAFREGKPSEVFQVPGTRLTQFLGMYLGIRYRQRLGRRLIRRLAIPETYQSVAINPVGQHALVTSRFPAIQQDQVIVQVAYAGVNPRDLAVARVDSAGHPSESGRYPITPGVEFSGIVVQTGKRARGFRIGQRVAGECSAGCGDCPSCVAGAYHACTNEGAKDGRTTEGPFAHYLAAAPAYLHKLPSHISLRHGVLVRTVAVCLEALRQLGAEPGRKACIIEAGFLGNVCVQIMRAGGLRVTAVDRDSRRLALLYKYDVDTLSEIDDPGKYDYLVETGGSSGMVSHLVEGSKPGARVLLLGLPRCRLDEAGLQQQADNGKLLECPWAAQHRSWEEAIRLVGSGRINLDDHAIEVLPLEAYKDAWARVERQEHPKVLLSISQELKGL